jgi:F-type H+-transporting ATPase subunit delta
MADGSLARRYARALLSLARDSGDVVAATDGFANDLERFAAVLDLDNGLLRSALENPGITLGERKGVLDAVLPKLELQQITKNFLSLLLDKGRFTVLPEIRVQYMAMADEQAGRVRATVSTARPISPELGAQVQASLEQATGKTVLVQFVVDPALIGGMVAKVGDTVYDASVRSRLMSVQQSLSASQGGAAEA